MWSVSVLSLEGGEIVLNDALSCPNTPADADFAVNHGAISGNPVLEICDFWLVVVLVVLGGAVERTGSGTTSSSREGALVLLWPSFLVPSPEAAPLATLA